MFVHGITDVDSVLCCCQMRRPMEEVGGGLFSVLEPIRISSEMTFALPLRQVPHLGAMLRCTSSNFFFASNRAAQ